MIPSQLAKEVIEAGKKATERPWRYCHGNINDHWEMWNQETATWIIQDDAGVEPSTDNLEYIVTSANHAEKLARICLVYEEKLKEIEDRKNMTNLGKCCVDKSCTPVYDDTGEKIGHCAFSFGVNRGFNTSAHDATDALEAASKIARGED